MRSRPTTGRSGIAESGQIVKRAWHWMGHHGGHGEPDACSSRIDHTMKAAL